MTTEKVREDITASDPATALLGMCFPVASMTTSALVFFLSLKSLDALEKKLGDCTLSIFRYQQPRGAHTSLCGLCLLETATEMGPHSNLTFIEHVPS